MVSTGVKPKVDSLGPGFDYRHLHQLVSPLDYKWRDTCSSSSDGRTSRCQREGHGFETRLLLQ